MKPMLAEDVIDFKDLTYPLYGSYKIDGVRALMPEATLLPRSLKTFGNQATVDFFSANAKILNRMDGELTLGPLPNPKGVRLCHLTSSAMSTFAGTPDIHWWIFDMLPMGPYPTTPFSERFTELSKWFGRRKSAQLRQLKVHMVEQTLILSPAEAMRFHETALSLHYEGTVFKSPDGVYKFGRSTLKQQSFLRYKPEADAEGEVVKLEPRRQNNNEATVNELGNSTRSSHKANKVDLDTLGAMHVKILNGPFKGKTVKIGTGWTAEEAAWMWANAAVLCTKGSKLNIVKFSYFPIGCKDLPRHPVWKSFRQKFDMS